MSDGRYCLAIIIVSIFAAMLVSAQVQPAKATFCKSDQDDNEPVALVSRTIMMITSKIPSMVSEATPAVIIRPAIWRLLRVMFPRVCGVYLLRPEQIVATT